MEGYGASWDSRANRLIFLDCFNGTITSYDPERNRTFTAVLPGIFFPSCVIPLKYKRDYYLVDSANNAVVIKWNRRDSNIKIIRQIFRTEPQPRFIQNGIHLALASTNGKFFVGGTFRGTFCSDAPTPFGGFYSYSKRTGLRKFDAPELNAMKTAGGIAQNAAGDKVFFVDICNRIILQFDFNSQNGHICKLIMHNSAI